MKFKFLAKRSMIAIMPLALAILLQFGITASGACYWMATGPSVGAGYWICPDMPNP